MAGSHEKKGRRAARPDTTEHRFVPQPSGRSGIINMSGGVGAALLGAGVYAQWVRDEPMASAPWVLAAGAAGLALSALLDDPGGAPLRVGSIGIAVEKRSSQPDRISWCDVEKVVLEGDAVVVHGPGGPVRAALATHGAAAAWIVKEADARVPRVVDIAPDGRARLPRPELDAGDTVHAELLQVAGRRCKASGKVISFEDDARLCAQCSQVYHREQVPERCLTCDAAMTKRAMTA
jgi:hypothetical protein